jgi:hypothetical protein
VKTTGWGGLPLREPVLNYIRKNIKEEEISD